MRIFSFEAMLFSLILLVAACQSGQSKHELDLLTYGVPIVLDVPEGTTVKKGDLGVLAEDVIVSNGDDFNMQIFISDAFSTDLKGMIASKKEDISSGPYFSKFVQEEDLGFIYETNIDSSLISYDFRFMKIIGDKEYLFQTGMLGNFTLNQVKQMFQSAKEVR